MSLKLLPTKSWNVYGYENRLRVEKDEAAAREKGSRDEERRESTDAEARLALLRKRAASLRGEQSELLAETRESVQVDTPKEQEEQEEIVQEEETRDTRGSKRHKGKKKKRYKDEDRGDALVPKERSRWYETGIMFQPTNPKLESRERWLKGKEDPLAKMKHAVASTKMVHGINAAGGFAQYERLSVEQRGGFLPATTSGPVRDSRTKGDPKSKKKKKRSKKSKKRKKHKKRRKTDKHDK